MQHLTGSRGMHALLVYFNLKYWLLWSLYRPPPFTVPGCTGRCPVTVCRACYYTKTGTRSQPDECPYECGMNPKQGCMKKWGKCVRQSYLGSFGKVMIDFAYIHVM